MFIYPLVIQNEQEHIKHIIDNIDFYKDVMFSYTRDVESPTNKKQKTEDIEKLNDVMVELENAKKHSESLRRMMETVAYENKIKSDQLIQQQEEIFKTKQLLEDSTRLEELLERKNGISVVNKGICDEKYVEIIMKEVASDSYIIDNDDGIRKMDIRLHRKDESFTIGIECKDKCSITKDDIDKFHRDKLSNKFHRSIFISTCPIKNIVENEDNIFVKGDELYIVTKNPVFLGAVMKLYLEQLDKEGGEDSNPTSMVFDSILNVYTNWQATKKQNAKFDKTVLVMMGLHPDFGDKLLSKHVYITGRNNIKDKFKY